MNRPEPTFGRRKSGAVVVYATLFGTTERVGEMIAAELGRLTEAAVAAHDLSTCDLAVVAGKRLVVFGASTWNVGQLPPDLELRTTELSALDLRGAYVALFGLGDQLGYPDTFVDAMGAMADMLQRTGGQLVGAWPASGYDFAASAAARGGSLVGLALDEDNEPSLTAGRVRSWAAEVASAAGLLERVTIPAR